MMPPRPASGHAFWWATFAVGGMVAAILVPAHILVQGVLGPLGVTPYLDGDYAAFSRALANPLAKAYVFVLVSLPIFHAAHRFHFWLHHLGLRFGRRIVAFASYSLAVAIAVVAAYVVLSAP